MTRGSAALVLFDAMPLFAAQGAHATTIEFLATGMPMDIRDFPAPSTVSILSIPALSGVLGVTIHTRYDLTLNSLLSMI